MKFIIPLILALIITLLLPAYSFASTNTILSKDSYSVQEETINGHKYLIIYRDMGSNATPLAPAVVHAADCEAKDNAALLFTLQTNNELLKKLVNPRQ